MEILISITIFIFGLCLGSFFACIGFRIPNNISTIKPNSFCPNCKKPLKWYMNIPLFSYIFLKGKCAFCKEKISIFYPLIEFLTALLFTASYIYFNFTLEFFIMIILISVLAITLVTDLKYFYISDRVIVLSILGVLITYFYYLDGNEIIYNIISAIVMFGIMLSIKKLGDFFFKKESLGGGDIKLMLLIGLTLGIINGITSLLISSSLALLFSLITLHKNEERIIPFGPFLILGTIITFICVYNGITII